MMHDSTIERYKDGYKVFCEAVVQQRLIANQEVLRMSKLTQLLIKLINKQEEPHMSVCA